MARASRTPWPRPGPASPTGQDPDGEGGVGGHGDGPAPGRWGEEREDQGRDRRPGQRGQDRRGGPPWIAEPADSELAFDLQPDNQEEDGHQGVVDPVPQIPGQAPHRERLMNRPGFNSGELQSADIRYVA